MKTAARWFSISLFVVTITTHAQFIRGYGVKVGLVAANQTWRYTFLPHLPTDNRWGFTSGIFLEAIDLPYLSVVAEVQYTQKGMNWTIPITTETQSDGTGEYVTRSPRVDYVSIPVLAKVRFSTPIAMLYILAGPRFDFLLYKNADGFDPIVHKFENSDFGATLGFGVERELSHFSILAEIRSNPNLKDSFNNEFLTVRNRSWDFVVGVRL